MGRTKYLLIISLLSLFVSEAFSQATAGWKHSIKNTLHSINKAVAMEVTDKGCYVLGTTWAPDSLKEMLLLKFNASGAEEWRRTYRHPDPGNNIPVALAVDTFGNAWLTGILRPKDSEGDADILVVKFTAEGVPDVSHRLKGPAGLYDVPSSVATDINGNAYIGGHVTSADSGLNAVLIKYDQLGTLKWSKTFTTLQMDVIKDVVTDDSSNAYVTGMARADMRTSDILIQKYDPEGTVVWQMIYDGRMMENDAGTEIMLDDSGNVYVTGFLNLMNGRSDVPLLKLDRMGQLLQENIIAGKIDENISSGLRVYPGAAYLSTSYQNYSMETSGSSVFKFSKGGKQSFTMKSPADVTFMLFQPAAGEEIAFGRKLARPENTWLPYICLPDTGGNLVWEYADSTVTGIADMVSVKVLGDKAYFLGDDTGDATGTITVMQYDIYKEQERK